MQLPRLVRLASRRLGHLSRSAGRRLAEVLGRIGDEARYRPRELLLVGCLAASLIAGHALERWNRLSGALEDLEQEPRRRPAGRPTPDPGGAPTAPGPEARPAPRRPDDSRGSGEPSRARGGPPPGSLVDLNGATSCELSCLPGVGPRLAARIVTLRQERGRFTALDELAELGLGPATTGRIAPLVTLGPAARADPCPGLGASWATADPPARLPPAPGDPGPAAAPPPEAGSAPSERAPAAGPSGARAAEPWRPP
jgi:competence protein ComEA